jgi:hypothetical protein
LANGKGKTLRSVQSSAGGQRETDAGPLDRAGLIADDEQRLQPGFARQGADGVLPARFDRLLAGVDVPLFRPDPTDPGERLMVAAVELDMKFVDSHGTGSFVEKTADGGRLRAGRRRSKWRCRWR